MLARVYVVSHNFPQLAPRLLCIGIPQGTGETRREKLKRDFSEQKGDSRNANRLILSALIRLPNNSRVIPVWMQFLGERCAAHSDIVANDSIIDVATPSVQFPLTERSMFPPNGYKEVDRVWDDSWSIYRWSNGFRYRISATFDCYLDALDAMRKLTH